MPNPVLLIFSDWFTPGYKAGGPIRSVTHIVDAVEDHMEVYIVTSDRDFEDTSPYPNITTQEWTPYGRRSHVIYASPGYLTHKTISGIISNIQPDTVYLNSMWSLSYTLWPLWVLKSRPAIKVVLAPRGMLKASAMRIKPIRKKIGLWCLKKWRYTNRVLFHSTSTEETAGIQKIFSNDVVTLSNIPSSLKVPKPIAKAIGQLSLVFISRIHPIKNMLFLLEVLKDMPQHISLSLHIYGPEEDKKYTQLCRAAASVCPSHVQVRFEGSIEHHLMTTVVQNHHFFILPTRGENFGHAIFESLAAGRPVVISDQTPWRHLQNQNVGFDLPLSSPADWINALLWCAEMDQTEYDDWCRNARLFAQNYIQQNQFTEKYLKLFRNEQV